MNESDLSEKMRVRAHCSGQAQRGWLVATVLIVSGGLFSPAALAGCSHSVTAKSDVSFHSSRLDPLVLFGRVSGDPSQSVPRSEPSAPRCSGFRCSENSDPTAPIVIAQGSLRIDAWSRPDPGTLLLPSNSTPLSLNDSPSSPSDRVDRLTRPPR